MYAHATPEEAKQLPGFESLKRNYRRWETEGVEPDKGRSELLFKPIIARTFGTVTHAIFPVQPRSDDTEVLAMKAWKRSSW
jgi:hypothetical protein